jgi:hypothetical protein
MTDEREKFGDERAEVSLIEATVVVTSGRAARMLKVNR